MQKGKKIKLEPCAQCEGTGEIEVCYEDRNFCLIPGIDRDDETKSCKKCNGRGAHYEKETCPMCNGSGINPLS